jgi:hypothetical protein
MPFYNHNKLAMVLFLAVPLIGMLAPLMQDKEPDYDRAMFHSGYHYLVFFLVTMLLFLTTAASERWARLLSKDKSRVADTRKGALVGAGACVLLIGLVLVLHR